LNFASYIRSAGDINDVVGQLEGHPQVAPIGRGDFYEFFRTTGHQRTQQRARREQRSSFSIDHAKIMLQWTIVCFWSYGFPKLAQDQLLKGFRVLLDSTSAQSGHHG